MLRRFSDQSMVGMNMTYLPKGNAHSIASNKNEYHISSMRRSRRADLKTWQANKSNPLHNVSD